MVVYDSFCSVCEEVGGVVPNTISIYLILIHHIKKICAFILPVTPELIRYTCTSII